MQSAELHLTKKVKVLKTALQRRGLVAPCVSKLGAELGCVSILKEATLETF